MTQGCSQLLPATEPRYALADMVKPSETEQQSLPVSGGPFQRALRQKRFVTLRTKLLALLSITALGLLVAIYIPLRVLVLGSYFTLEDQMMRTELGRAQNALTGAITKLENSAAGYATWDDTYAFVEDHNDQYMAVNLADPSFPAENINLVIIANTSAEVVGAKAFDLSQQRATAVPAYFTQPATIKTLLASINMPNHARNGIVILPEGPMLLASQPILPSSGQGPSRGTMLMGRFLDNALEQELADSTHLQLSFHPPTDSQLPAEAQGLSTAQPESTKPFTSESIAGYRLLLDIFDQPALVLQVDEPRSIYQQGSLTVNYVSLALMMVLLASFIAGAIGLNRLVVTRVARLDARAHDIGASGDLSQRMEVQGNDELTRLAQSINGMLAELEYSQMKRQQADELRAQTQEELLRAREQFSQMLVHDLKSPLTAATGYLDILNLMMLNEEQQSLADGAQKGIKNALMLVNQILDIARLSEGRLEIRREPADVRRMYESCINELRPWASLENTTLQIMVPPAFPRLLVDTSLLQRVLHNLVSNAIKHTPSNVTVTLGARQTDTAIELYIHDNGPGIEPDMLPELFERFRTSTPKHERQSNTGLGLTFCKLAIEAHSGTLTVQSNSIQGTTFIISLSLQSIAPRETTPMVNTREVGAIEVA